MRALIFTLIISLAFGPVARAMDGPRCGEQPTSTSAGAGVQAGSTSSSIEEPAVASQGDETGAPSFSDHASSPPCKCPGCHCPPGYQCAPGVALASPPPSSDRTPADPLPPADAISVATVAVAPADRPPISTLH